MISIYIDLLNNYQSQRSLSVLIWMQDIIYFNIVIILYCVRFQCYHISSLRTCECIEVVRAFINNICKDLSNKNKIADGFMWFETIKCYLRSPQRTKRHWNEIHGSIGTYENRSIPIQFML